MSSVKAISKQNGGIYTIGEAKFKAEPNDWVLFVEEEEVKELSYKELKALLKEKDIEFKGNASREQLMNLLDES